MSGLSRRAFLGGVAGVIGAGGVYRLVEELTSAPARVASTVADEQHGSIGVPREQHLMNNISTSRNGVVLIPPRHLQIITGRLRLPTGRTAVLAAQRRLEATLREIDARFDPAHPSGLGVMVAWSLPYFHRYVPGPAAAHLPVDLQTTEKRGTTTLAVTDAVRFPSDPASVVLERNDFAVVLRSDHLSRIDAGTRMLLDGLGDDVTVTSVRKGFVGGGFGGAQSLPKRMATAAEVPGAEQIPDSAELFMGFISTHTVSQGPPQGANLETWPGVTDQWPAGYFRYGTTMHLSHVVEDLVTWYSRDFPTRVTQMFKAGLDVAPGDQFLPQGTSESQDLAAVQRDVARGEPIGHSGSLQPVTRLHTTTTDNYGNVHPPGTAIFQRADANTVDNPFAFSAQPARDRYSSKGAAGIHFVGLASTSDITDRMRLAMDGRYACGGSRQCPVVSDPKAPGINAVIQATHRQNFLVPPRAHRSFPLAELL
jgi:hypothetical protein